MEMSMPRKKATAVQSKSELNQVLALQKANQREQNEFNDKIMSSVKMQFGSEKYCLCCILL